MLKFFEQSKFAFSKEKNILCDRHLGVSGNRLSVLTPESAIGKIECLQACPYSNSAFIMDVRIAGERVPAKDWKWLPNLMYRTGETRQYEIQTLVAIPNNMRCAIMSVTLKKNFVFCVRLLLGIDMTCPVIVASFGASEYKISLSEILNMAE